MGVVWRLRMHLDVLVMVEGVVELLIVVIGGSDH